MSNLHKNNLVAQANKLIEARYTITKNEQLLLFAMISLINPRDKEFLTFTTTTEQLSRILDIHPATAVREFDKITDRLMSRVIKLNTPNGWRKLQWVSNAEIENNIIVLKFHNDLKPYLLALKKSGNFTQVRLGMVIHFRSVYTIRIYQLLKEYDSKYMSYFEFSLEEFRKIMLGYKAKSYPLFKNFRNKILDVAKRELEKKDSKTDLYESDLSFDLETRRTGRKISHLKFIIKNQKTKSDKQLQSEALEEENFYQNSLEYKAMLLIAISEKKAQAFLKQYGAEYIGEKIQVLKERQAVESIKSPSGFFIKALNEDWKSEKLAQQAKEAELRARKKRKILLEQVARRKNELDFEYGKIAKKEFLESLNQKQKNDLLEEMKTLHQGNSWALNDINKNGLSSMMIGMNIVDKIPNYKEKKEVYISKKIKKEFKLPL